MNEERKGELYIWSMAFLWSLFPIVTAISISSSGPLFALAATTFFSFLFFLFLFIRRGKWSALRNKSALKDISFVALFNGILFYAFFFFGLRFTSAGNASIIGLMEIFYTFLIFNVLRKESIPKNHIAGAALMLFGASIIFLPGVINHFSVNIGDLIILIGAVFGPLGNFFQRSARRKVNSETIMLVRSFITVPFVLLLAYAGKENISLAILNGRVIWYIAFSGVILLGLSKIFWIEAIHRISVTKAISLSSISPFLTLIFAFILLHQAPTAIQIVSLIPLFAGVMLLTRSDNRRSDRLLLLAVK